MYQMASGVQHRSYKKYIPYRMEQNGVHRCIRWQVACSSEDTKSIYRTEWNRMECRDVSDGKWRAAQKIRKVYTAQNGTEWSVEMYQKASGVQLRSYEKYTLYHQLK